MYSHCHSPAQDTWLHGAIIIQSAKQNSSECLIILIGQVQHPVFKSRGINKNNLCALFTITLVPNMKVSKTYLTSLFCSNKSEFGSRNFLFLAAFQVVLVQVFFSFELFTFVSLVLSTGPNTSQMVFALELTHASLCSVHLPELACDPTKLQGGWIGDTPACPGRREVIVMKTRDHYLRE